MKKIGRTRRHKRITKRMKGSQVRPRLVVFKSKKHLYVQFINDARQRSLSSCSTLSKEFKSKGIKGSNKEAAKELGKIIAQKALSLGIKDICFDRGGYKYHGRIKSLADGIREGGFKF